MDSRIFVLIGIVALLVMGSIFVSAGDTVDTAEEPTVQECGGAAGCGAGGCNGACGGECGVPSCGCGK